MFQWETHVVGPLSVNTVLLWQAETRNAVLVDPGDNVQVLQNALTKLGLSLEAIFLTHGHFDHFGAAAALQFHWKCPVYAHPGDFDLIEHCETQTSLFGMPAIQPPALQALTDGEIKHGLKVIHTPGHSPGGCGFLVGTDKGPLLCAGDTLFCGGVGRTDLLMGNWETLEKSIRTRLYCLTDDTQVIPGHGPFTTIGQEATRNPYVRR